MVATAASVGVPEIKPVAVLKPSPVGRFGEIAKLAISPPLELITYPVIAVPTVAFSDVEESVNAGLASFVVNV